jgi:two-component system, chemotaxis family, response regulator WspR
MSMVGDRSKGGVFGPRTNLDSAAAAQRRTPGPVVLLVEAGGASGAAMEARLGADGAIRCERANGIEEAGYLATAAGATVIVLLPGAGPDRFEVMGALHGDPATAGLPIVVVDEGGNPTDRRNAFAAGADDFWSGWPDPLEARARLFALSRGVIAERQRDEANRELLLLRARLGEASILLAKGQNVDEVTGLPTRRRLLEQLDAEWRRARRGGGPLSLVLIELERTNGGPRTVEDDACLARVASALRSVLRRGGDLLARYAENQLAAALPEVGPDGAAAVAQALRHAAVAIEPSLRYTTGIVTARPQESVSENPGALIAAAEESLARARP